MEPGSVDHELRTASLKQLVMNLFDAVRFSERLGDLDGKIEAVERDLEEKLSKLEGLAQAVSKRLDELVDQVGAEYAGSLSTQVTGFVEAAVDRAKVNVKSELGRRVSQLKAQALSEKTKALKSLEAYLSSSPLPKEDQLIVVSLKDGAYEAHVAYTCKGEISYKFSLSTQGSKLFQREFRGVVDGTKINIPVEVSKSWIRKEPSPHFEKLERYALKSCEVSRQHLIAQFWDEGSNAVIRIAGPPPGGQGFTTVEYVDGSRVVNVTSDQGLVRFLDPAPVGVMVKQLWDEVSLLESGKVALSELTLEGEDLLGKLECGKLLRRVLDVMGATYRKTLRKNAQDGDGDVTPTLVAERLALLKGSPVMESAEAALATEPKR